MPYSAEISRLNPSCFLFLVDQSGSMNDAVGGGGGRRKAEGVADAINNLLKNLVVKCSKDEGIRDYYNVGVIGYGNSVGPAFGGGLSGRDLVPVSDVGAMPLRMDERQRKVEDGTGGLVETTVKLPIWFEAVANGGTPMCQALTQAQGVIGRWLEQHPSSFPPIVFNLTDGESTDGDPTAAASALRSMRSIDGETLLFNCHISSSSSPSIEFADSDVNLPDNFARQLFAMSSVLPPHILAAARGEGLSVSEMSRGFAFNADMVALIKLIDIGTRPSNLR